MDIGELVVDDSTAHAAENGFEEGDTILGMGVLLREIIAGAAFLGGLVRGQCSEEVQLRGNRCTDAMFEVH